LTRARRFCKALSGVRLTLREAAMISVPRIAMVAFAALLALLGLIGFRDFTRSPYTGIQHSNLVIRAIEAWRPAIAFSR
jgi:hypothetical protein